MTPLFLLVAVPLVLAADRPPEGKARGRAEKVERSQVGWMGEELPPPLLVRTPEDLAVKALAEKQYLQFSLLVQGKAAFDRGEWAQSAERWESLLRLSGLSAEVEATVRPLARLARERAGGAVSSGQPLPVPQAAAPSSAPSSEGPASSGAEEPARPAAQVVTVSGTVTGGGPQGPGGSVVLLRRADGATPRPRSQRIRAVAQKDKRFVPHVLAVPVGSTVEFRNDDDIFHNVFSLSRPNDFDLGLYKSGASRDQVFATPGPVQLLCNIHASMNAWIYVSDTPYYAQADGAGRFTVKGVPPGNYTLEVWHEWAQKTSTRPVRVAAGMEEVSVAVDGDRRPPAFVPDKAGKPRQPQLGY
jgi:plastocyanin